MPAHMTTPCENCPYRVDAPRKLWHRQEFEKLLESERQDNANPFTGGTYACHKQIDMDAKDRGFCAGWLLNQKTRGVRSIPLRMMLITNESAQAAFDAVSSGGAEMFESVEAMCRANGVRPERGR